ncbi:ABC transporter permease [Amycolatopsis acidicola]|uniref:ABC transporter permease n=1 Tax=Amycolatopsis acidicola TaxID=2596893 RepID=A0A5N0UN56_9PSEU|nr:ABC transporter permease [Amycolatopsis acidicola]KAA9151859.1 ABC transporter permease [Amycolatopsis acidicola]
MVRYTGARLLQGLAAVVVVVTIVFFLARLSGDAAALLAPPDATPQQLDAVRESLGLNDSLFVQYGHYLGGLLTGDLGESVSFRAPVAGLVLPAMGYTAVLALVSFALALVAGVALGTFAAFRSGTRSDHAVRLLSVLGQSIPPFWLGMVLVLVVSVGAGLLPAFGAVGPESLVLPALALAALPTAGIARLTRSAVLEVLGRDQTTFLRSKGVSPRVLVTHVLRNASLPVVTLAGIQLGVLFSGTIVIENLFAWPGVGLLAIQAIQAKDFALIQGIVVVNVVVFVLLLFLIDLSYGVLDPRVRARRAVAVPVREAAAR